MENESFDTGGVFFPGGGNDGNEEKSLHCTRMKVQLLHSSLHAQSVDCNKLQNYFTRQQRRHGLFYRTII